METLPRSLGSLASISERGTCHVVGARSVASLLVLVFLIGMVRPARAVEDEQVQAHVRSATAAYDLGNYAEAAREYEAAYMKSLNVNLLVSVGQAWRQAGERRKALTAFRSYVRIAPEGEHAAMCMAKIQELEGQRGDPPPARPWVHTQPIVAPSPDGPNAGMVAPPASYAIPPATAPFIPSQGCETRVESSSFYQAWSFWTAVGLMFAAGVVAGVYFSGYGDDLAMPSTSFGAKRF
jgi:tetratricopeptide (TPR) repeat protein